MARQYFIKRGSKVHGPFSFEQLKSGLHSGKIDQSESVSETNVGPWTSLGQIFSNEAAIIPEGERSIFENLELPQETENISMFRQGSLQETPYHSDAQDPSQSIAKPQSPDYEVAASSYLEAAERDIKTQEGTPSQSESLVPGKARYFVHAIISALCGLMLALFCPLFCFIPMGLIYKHFQDKEEDLISYMYLGWGVVSALGSIMFLGMAWQGSLKYGEQIGMEATGYESNAFQDGWTHPVIWFFSDDEAKPKNHKITRERIRSTEKTIKDFYKTYRRLPPSFDDLQYKVLTKSKPAPKDEWGQVLVLSTTADKTSSMYRIISSGPDREMGTDDDLVVSGSAK